MDNAWQQYTQGMMIPAIRLKLSHYLFSKFSVSDIIKPVIFTGRAFNVPKVHVSKYPSTEFPTEQRKLIARLVGPLEARGISRSVFREVLADAEVIVPKSSLDRWVSAHTATGRIFSAEKASGAVPLLDDEQCEIAAGWVLSQNDSNQAVSLASFSKFCATAFGVKLAKTTAYATVMKWSVRGLTPIYDSTTHAIYLNPNLPSTGKSWS